jgi:hypothetical protein
MSDDLATVGTETTPSPPGDAALSALSKSDDATRYIEERQSQEAEDKGQEPETPKDERQNHIEQAIDLIRRTSPQELWHSINRGAANFQQEAYVQRRILEDRIAQGRRTTQAPPPIVPPRGTANVPRDMFRTAEKSDATDYVKMRRAQMARDAQDR